MAFKWVVSYLRKYSKLRNVKEKICHRILATKIATQIEETGKCGEGMVKSASATQHCSFKKGELIVSRTAGKRFKMWTKYKLCTHIHTHIHRYIYKQTYTQRHRICTYKHTYTCTHKHTHIHTCTQIHIDTLTQIDI